MLRSRFATCVSALVVITTATHCSSVDDSVRDGSASTSSGANAASYAAVQSALPADRLAKLKAALPSVAYPHLQEILKSDQTFWYDGDSMTPSYQKTTSIIGAHGIKDWIDDVAVPDVGRAYFYDDDNRRFKFPFGTTAGTDKATESDLHVFNFLWLPQKNGKLVPVTVTELHKNEPVIGGQNSGQNMWAWVYPVGATLGELIFVKNGEELLPSEVRIRTRYANGWATNAFRPFPTAASFSAAIKAKRPSWNDNAQLRVLVQHLDGNDALTPLTLSAPYLPGTFEQAGAIDVLPDVGDAQLVKELLTQTTFTSAYGETWKAAGGKKAYAASTKASVSIVPKNYEAGIFEVNEASCMRCHKDTAKKLTEFREEAGPLELYGEMWGRDGVFSFHPYDESQYFNFPTYTDNREVNQKLVSSGLIKKISGSLPTGPDYPAKEIGNGYAGEIGN